MTVSELIVALQALERAGYGVLDVKTTERENVTDVYVYENDEDRELHVVLDLEI